MNTSHPPLTSLVKLWKAVPTRSGDVARTKIVCRPLGPESGVPVIMLNHSGAVLDNFDPRIGDGFAETKAVTAFDYPGIGASGAKAPLAVAKMAKDTIAFSRALSFEDIDLLGFSPGGLVAQESVPKAPDLDRKVILTGTGPAAGEGTVYSAGSMA